jgi:hypothetical protein
MGARISTSSSDSTGATDPTDPVDPVDPVDPTDPTEPTDPVVPDTGPTDPVVPTVTTTTFENQPIPYDSKGSIKKHFDLLKTNLYDIAAQENNDIKVARWNTYYYKKYKMECIVFTYIIVVCIIINILTLLHKTYPYFDASAYMIIVGAILGISILVVFYVYLIILNKDNMNFDENDYGTNNSKISGTSANTGYVEASFNDLSNCIVRDPNNVANTNYLKQLF